MMNETKLIKRLKQDINDLLSENHMMKKRILLLTNTMCKLQQEIIYLEKKNKKNKQLQHKTSEFWLESKL